MWGLGTCDHLNIASPQWHLQPKIVGFWSRHIKTHLGYIVNVNVLGPLCAQTQGSRAGVKKCQENTSENKQFP